VATLTAENAALRHQIAQLQQQVTKGSERFADALVDSSPPF
jgi:hypothetical protein